MRSVRKGRRLGRYFYALAGVEKLLLTAQQSELVRGFGAHLSAKAVELLAMDTNDVEPIASPPQKNGAKDGIEIRRGSLLAN
jgi:hypothetical protein